METLYVFILVQLDMIYYIRSPRDDQIDQKRIIFVEKNLKINCFGYEMT